jgi:hypothetical protein
MQYDIFTGFDNFLLIILPLFDTVAFKQDLMVSGMELYHRTQLWRPVIFHRSGQES